MATVADVVERVCEISDCENTHVARGYCGKHYQRWRTKGDPHRVAYIQGDDAKRFWSKVDASGDCWEWTAGTKSGYGQFKVDDQQQQAHRWAYEHLVGPIPDGLTLDHLCRNPPCVKPDHLEPVTIEENIRRGFGVGMLAAKKTHCKHGHPLDEENTYVYVTKTGKRMRQCRACHRRHSRNWHRRNE